MCTYTIMGIDPGSNTGVSIVKVDCLSNRVVSIKTMLVKASVEFANTFYKPVPVYTDLTPTDRAKLVANKVAQLVQVHAPDTVVIEGAFFHRFTPGAFGPLLTMIMYIETAIYERTSISLIHKYQPQEIKAAIRAVCPVSLKGLKPKDIVLVGSKNIPEIANAFAHMDSHTDHEIDSVGIAFTHLLRYRLSSM